jgi:MoCo/4Fe-4S cofactor protein with predicted Tat translocation signal
MENTQDQKNNSYWKSLDEKYMTPEFIKQVENEFQSSPLKEGEDKNGMARRQFMKLMGASVALSTAACVRRPVQKIIPYNKRPSEVVIGIPNYYASSFYDGIEGFSVTVKTREGRPLFVSGNPSYPGNATGLSVRGTSQLLSLYDPDRVRTPIVNSQDPKKRGNKLSIPRNWESIDKKVIEKLGQGKVHILTSDTTSPSLKSVLNKFSANTGTKIHYWSPINQSEILEAAQLSYGRASVPKYRFDKAKMIVSIDGDFLGTHLNPIESSKLFSMGRDPEKASMSRLVSFQSVTSLTSLNADDNYGIQASQQLPLVLAMIYELGSVQKKVSISSKISSMAQPFANIYEKINMTKEDFSTLVSDLWNSRGQSIVLAGGLQSKTKDSLSLQIAINYLNSLLDNDGQTIQWAQGLLGRENSDKDLSELMKLVEAGEVKTLIINELNPLFYLPNSKKLKETLTKIETVVVTNNWMDETAELADLVAPAGHSMENWGDHEFEPGLMTMQQPTISPLYDTRSFADSLMAWSKGINKPVSNEENFYSYVKSSWISRVGSEKAWFDLLQKGYSGKAFEGTERALGFNTSSLEKVKITLSDSPIQMSLYAKSTMYDGTLTNVSWLQELPDPVSKIVWDNYLMISPILADEFKLRDGSMVEVKTAQKTMKLPVYISPGMHKGSVAIAVGYGRTKGGELHKNVGFNVQDFILVADEQYLQAGFPVEIKKTSDFYDLAQTQGHHNMEGRQLAVEATAKSYKSSGDIGFHKHKVFSIWEGHKYDGHKWGLGVDLNSCTGCSACMLACQSENNIPVVGKKYVLGGREMHWIRIDRYFSGDEKKSVDAIFQPVMCQQCENAPCETVCPVLATVHSDEGLNDMIYNRCVGTRYCSNNCPYKVRRFNWFYYDGHHRKEPLHMALNPDVTVRTRGVMEKCTFCVQRIKDAKNIAKDEKREMKDGDIKTACQEVCPTDAIVFGDLNDKSSKLNQWFESQRNYTLLEEFNAAPRVRYLAKIRNTNRELGGGHHASGHSNPTTETEHKEGH